MVSVHDSRDRGRSGLLFGESEEEEIAANMPDTFHISDTVGKRTVSIRVDVSDRGPGDADELAMDLLPELGEHGQAYTVTVESWRVKRDGSPDGRYKRAAEATFADLRVSAWEHGTLLHRLEAMIARMVTDSHAADFQGLAGMALDWMQERGLIPGAA